MEQLGLFFYFPLFEMKGPLCSRMIQDTIESNLILVKNIVLASKLIDGFKGGISFPLSRKLKTSRRRLQK
jgi:hypothetical protein